MQSTSNQTYVPLNAGSIFIGKYDDVLMYDTADYTIYSDRSCQIELYQSNDKKNYVVSTYNYTATGTSVTNEFPLKQRYIYVTIRNTSGFNQTYLQFTMIYKTSSGEVQINNLPNPMPVSVSTPLGQTTMSASLPVALASDQSALNVIVASTPTVKLNDGYNNPITSTSNALNSYITNSSLAVTDSSAQSSLSNIDTVINTINNNLTYSAYLWNNVAISANATVSFAQAIYGSKLTIFGTTSATTNLTFAFSVNNTTFFPISALSCSAPTGNYVYSFPMPYFAPYIQITSSEAVTITLCVCVTR
jgi:hypothetical protein